MGWEDTERAYDIALPEVKGIFPSTLRGVLNVIAAATDEDTHSTFISRPTIAKRSGVTLANVKRALDVLDQLGVITRESRKRSNGAQSSNLITLRTGVTPTLGEAHPEPAPRVTPTSPPGVTPTLGEAHPEPGAGSPRAGGQGQGEPGNEIHHLDPSIDPPLITVEAVIVDPFDEFWAAWPNKKSKPAARRAWDKAQRERRKPAADIIAAAIAYRDNPHRPPPEFIPHPSTWLNNDRWDDPLDGPRGTGRPTPTQRVAALAEAGSRLQERRGLQPITLTLNPKGLNP